MPHVKPITHALAWVIVQFDKVSAAQIVVNEIAQLLSAEVDPSLLLHRETDLLLHKLEYLARTVKVVTLRGRVHSLAPSIDPVVHG
jgi:hypothetical protein